MLQQSLMTMATKLNSFYTLILFFVISAACGQQAIKIPVPSTQIQVSGITNVMSINECKSILGAPIKFVSKIYEIGPDGLEEGYTLAYDSFNIVYIKYYGEVIMSSMEIFGKKYKIDIGGIPFSIGDSLSKLKPLLSSNYDCEEITKNIDDEIVRIVYDVLTIRDNSKSNGSLSIEIENGIIKRMGIVFDEELT